MYTVGAIIKNEREKHKISQEELCFGICAVSTLSRIEHNEHVYTKINRIKMRFILWWTI